jgi:hypothetical protein
MHRWVHPHRQALAPVQALAAAHTATEQITEQQLLGQRQGGQERI